MKEYYSAQEVGTLLQLNSAEVQRRTQDHDILGLPLNKEVVYPTWQFSEDNTPLPNLRILYGLYADALQHNNVSVEVELEFALWLLATPDNETETRVDLLKNNPDHGLYMVQRLHSDLLTKATT